VIALVARHPSPLECRIALADLLFAGEDKQIVFEVLQAGELTSDANADMRDVSGWTLAWALMRQVGLAPACAAKRC
jgi:hypothetical protein